MPNHRRKLIAGFAPDPAWSALQTAPVLPASDLIETVRTVQKGKLLWHCVGYNGAGDDAKPVDGTGLSCEAQLIYRRHTEHGATEYLALPSITLAAGDPVVELDIPYQLEGWLRLIALVAAGPATHLWLSYDFVKGAP